MARLRGFFGIGGVLTALVLLGGCGGGGNTETYRVPSEAMEPTYAVGDEVTFDLDAYDGAAPEAGDVVIFHPSPGAERAECGAPVRSGEPCARPTAGSSSETFVKRVVAGPGDTLSIEAGYAVVNGEVRDEPYAAACGSGGSCNMPRTITIPPEMYFMLGDNRGASDDSRFWGPVRVSQILGRAE